MACATATSVSARVRPQREQTATARPARHVDCSDAMRCDATRRRAPAGRGHSELKRRGGQLRQRAEVAERDDQLQQRLYDVANASRSVANALPLH